ncbi:MAG TPA: hypothetical protein VFV02_06990, partial [Acidimicrobiales bacterium]|nr:hypothetical protein [Acidimicrobiales bacterium]
MPEVPNTQDDSIEIGPFLLCPHCKEGRKFEEQTFIKYFQGTELLCRNCSKKINLWKGVLSLLTDSPFIRYGAIGANSTAFQVPITLGEPREITFEEFGVPSEAQILWLNYTPQGGNLQALEMHGNTPSRYSIPSVVTIYPIPFNEGKPTSEGVLNILVIWAKFEGDETESAAWRNLVEATDFFMQGRLRQSLIPSQTVVELMLSQFLSRYYSRVAAHEYVDRMFNGGASYS